MFQREITVSCFLHAREEGRLTDFVLSTAQSMDTTDLSKDPAPAQAAGGSRERAEQLGPRLTPHYLYLRWPPGAAPRRLPHLPLPNLHPPPSGLLLPGAPQTPLRPRPAQHRGSRPGPPSCPSPGPWGHPRATDPLPGCISSTSCPALTSSSDRCPAVLRPATKSTSRWDGKQGQGTPGTGVWVTVLASWGSGTQPAFGGTRV